MFCRDRGFSPRHKPRRVLVLMSVADPWLGLSKKSISAAAMMRRKWGHMPHLYLIPVPSQASRAIWPPFDARQTDCGTRRWAGRQQKTLGRILIINSLHFALFPIRTFPAFRQFLIFFYHRRLLQPFSLSLSIRGEWHLPRGGIVNQVTISRRSRGPCRCEPLKAAGFSSGF